MFSGEISFSVALIFMLTCFVCGYGIGQYREHPDYHRGHRDAMLKIYKIMKRWK